MATRDPATAGLPSSSSSSSSTLASGAAAAAAAAPQGSRGPQPGSASVAANKAAGNAHNYASTVATQSDVVKYRGKYKELKAKIRDIEAENDEIHLRTLNLKRTIQRMRLERAVLYERLEAAQMVPGAAAPPPRHIRPASPPNSSNIPFAQQQQQQQQQQEHFQPPMPRPMAETHAEEDLPRITLANGDRVIPSVLAPVSSLRASYATPVGAGGGAQQQQQQQQASVAGAGGSNGNGSGNGNGAMKVTLRRGGAQQQQQQPATMAEQATATSLAPAPPSVPEQQQPVGAGQAGSPPAGAQRPGSGASGGAGSPPS